MSPTQDTTALRDRVGASPVPVAAGETGQAIDSSLRGQIKRMESQWATALPKTVSPDRFVRTVLTEVSKNPQLAECDTLTVLGAVTAAAQLGLEFGPLGLAYLVPFYNGRKRQRECQFILGYKGLLQLARRSGDVKDIIARAVHENDTFDFYADEEGDHLMHRPALDEPGPIIRYYMRCTFTNGGSLVMPISLADINKRRARSQSGDSSFSPWTSDPEAMSLKTCIKIAQPWLPLATEVAQGIAQDEQVLRLSGSGLVVERPPSNDATAAITAQEAETGDSDPEPADTSAQDAPRAPENEGLVEPPPDDEPWDDGAQEPPQEAESATSDSAHAPVTADPALEARVKAVLDTMTVDKLRETAGLFGMRREGSKAALAVRLLPVLVGEMQAGNQAALDLI